MSILKDLQHALDKVAFLEDAADVVGSLVGGTIGKVEHEIVSAVRGVTSAIAGLKDGTMTLEEARAAVTAARSQLRDDLATGDSQADEAAARLPSKASKDRGKK
jgi:hypothetical protein